jgi:hypothetical protein
VGVVIWEAIWVLKWKSRGLNWKTTAKGSEGRQEKSCTAIRHAPNGIVVVQYLRYKFLQAFDTAWGSPTLTQILKLAIRDTIIYPLYRPCKYFAAKDGELTLQTYDVVQNSPKVTR